MVAIMLLYENCKCAVESRDQLPTAEVLKIMIIEVEVHVKSILFEAKMWCF